MSIFGIDVEGRETTSYQPGSSYFSRGARVCFSGQGR